MVASAPLPTVELQGFFPTIPSISPGAEVECLVDVPGGSLASPILLITTASVGYAATSSIGYLDSGVLKVWAADEGFLPFLPTVPVACHAPRGTGVAVSDGYGVTGINIESGATGLLPLGGLPAPMLLAQMPGGRLMGVCGAEADTVVCLGGSDDEGGEAEDPQLVLGGYGPIAGLYVSPLEDRLWLSIGSSVYAAALDPDTLACATPAELYAPIAGSGTPLPAGALAADTLGNVYVCTPEGVHVVDENGDPRIIVSMGGEPATGVCFGGLGCSTLFLTTPTKLWSIKTNVQGAVPPSPAFMKKMDIQHGGGDFRHAGW